MHTTPEDLLRESSAMVAQEQNDAVMPLAKPHRANLNAHGHRTETRMRALRQNLSKLDDEINKLAKLQQSKIDLQDRADIQALLDYSVLVSQFVAEGRASPEMAASMQIANLKVSTLAKDGSVERKGPWYARTLRKKAKHVCEWATLPERKQGKGAAHPSLLDDPRILQAAKQFALSLAVGKVSHVFMSARGCSD